MIHPGVKQEEEVGERIERRSSSSGSSAVPAIRVGVSSGGVVEGEEGKEDDRRKDEEQAVGLVIGGTYLTFDEASALRRKMDSVLRVSMEGREDRVEGALVVGWRALTVALPRPEAPPVMMAVRPAKRPA